MSAQRILSRWVSRTEVADERLTRFDFAKTASRQEALLTIFASLLDIFDHLISDFFSEKPTFQCQQDYCKLLAVLFVEFVGEKAKGVISLFCLEESIDFRIGLMQLLLRIKQLVRKVIGAVDTEGKID
jgi:hypothetical protein